MPAISNWNDELALTIERLRSELLASSSAMAQTMRSAAQRSGGLPIYVDLGAYVVLLPTGKIEVLDSTTLEELDARSFEDGKAWLEHALACAGTSYPALSNSTLNW